MSGPMMSVMVIGGTVVAALLLFFLLLKTVAVQNAFNRTFGWIFVVGLVVAALAGGVSIFLNGVGSSVALPLMLAIVLFNLTDAPRQGWARAILWLSGALLTAVILWRWPDLRTFAEDGLGDKFFTALLTGLLLYSTGQSLYRLFRPRTATPPSTPSAETETPA